MALEQRLTNDLVELYADAETDILRDMARRISAYDYFIPAAQHQKRALEELGRSREEITSRLSEYTGRSSREIVRLLSEASRAAVAADVDCYTAAGVYEPSKVDSEALHAKLNRGLINTQSGFFNIVGRAADTTSGLFKKALDKAWIQINAGGFDYNRAIRNAVSELAEAGVCTVERKNGSADNIEAAVRRILVTGANQTAMKTQEELADELGIELVEVTAHGGARPDHAKWQGKIYGRRGKVTVGGITYEDFESATRYGHGDGLGGWNCRHSFHPYIPGAPRAYSEKALKEEKKVEYNGKALTEYEASQIQRGFERDIRKQKRKAEALEAAGLDSSAERGAVREAREKYADFARQTGMKAQLERAWTLTSVGNGSKIEPKADKP